MTLTVEAIYANGVFTPKQPLTLAEGTEVYLTIRTLQEDADPFDEVIGICTEGPDISLAAHHDELLYGLRPPAKEQP